MRDGNKEAAKELMSTFRLVVGAAVSVFLLFANLQIRNFLRPKNGLMFDIGLTLALVSVLLCCWLFFLVVGKLYREEEGIAYQTPVLTIGGAGIVAFVASVALLIWSQV